MDPTNQHHRSSRPGIKMCEAVDCYEAATETIIVSAGKFGTINLSLCRKCADSKFPTGINPPRRYLRNTLLQNDKITNIRADDNSKCVTRGEQTKQGANDIYPQAIQCPRCGKIVIAELDPISANVTLYNFESGSKDQRVVHEHTADPITVARVSKRVFAERRLLGEINPHDYICRGV
jgi:hypothetical protein